MAGPFNRDPFGQVAEGGEAITLSAEWVNEVLAFLRSLEHIEIKREGDKDDVKYSPDKITLVIKESEGEGDAFCNAEQTYEATCPGLYPGDPVTKTVEADTLCVHTSVEDANELALELATLRAEAELVCEVSTTPAITGGDSFVNAIEVVAATGKILIAGSFETVGGIFRPTFAQLNSNMSLDTPHWYHNLVGGGARSHGEAIAVAADGKYLFGYNSYTATSTLDDAINDSLRIGVARLLNTGRVDTGFDSSVTIENSPDDFPGQVWKVNVIAGPKVFIAGYFDYYNGTARKNVAIINSDGTVDTGFDPGDGPNGAITAAAFPYIAGGFSSYDGDTDFHDFVKISTSGAVDAGFDVGTGCNGTINALAIDGSGNVIVAGTFSTYDGTAVAGIARLESDGDFDASFDPGTGPAGPSPVIFCTRILASGKILVGGAFTSFDGVSRKSIVLLNSDGSVDTAFDAGTITGGTGAQPVYAVAVQAGGQVIIGGDFGAVQGSTRTNLARLSSTGTLLG